MVPLLYSFGWLYTFIISLNIFKIKKNKLSKIEKLLILSVAIIPLGKLIYLSIPGLIGMEFSFIFAIFISLIWLIVYGIQRYAIAVLLLLLIIPLCSLSYIEDMDKIMFYQLNEEQRESSLLRFVSIFILVFYSTVIYSAILRKKEIYSYIIHYYLAGVFYASLIGIFIFIFVYLGILSESNLAPISAGVHIINDNIYRFNPGANVNEFSMLLAYAIFMIPLANYSTKKKLFLAIFFLVLEGATLTRASWIALLLAVFVGAFFMKNKLKLIMKLFGLVVIFCIIMYISYLNSPEVAYLIDSRTSMSMGASGEERLEKFGYVFMKIFESEFRLLFGYGWATNMYVHNVYLQLLYEIGIIGLSVFIIAVCFYMINIFSIKNSNEKFFLVATLVFLLVVSTMHHTLYHMQTWLMLGIIAGISAQYRMKKSKCKT